MRKNQHDSSGGVASTGSVWGGPRGGGAGCCVQVPPGRRERAGRREEAGPARLSLARCAEELEHQYLNVLGNHGQSLNSTMACEDVCFWRLLQLPWEGGRDGGGQLGRGGGGVVGAGGAAGGWGRKPGARRPWEGTRGCARTLTLTVKPEVGEGEPSPWQRGGLQRQGQASPAPAPGWVPTLRARTCCCHLRSHSRAVSVTPLMCATHQAAVHLQSNATLPPPMEFQNIVI